MANTSMFSFATPSEAQATQLLEQQKGYTYSYSAIGCSRSSTDVRGFTHDHLRMQIGSGNADFARAKAAISTWQMFPKWTRVLPHPSPIAPDTTVITCIHAFGVWWLNPARIVYTIDEPKRFGFAYGTLPDHVESGEELFSVTQSDDGTVYYELRAFSRPRWLPARIGYPVVRLLQARFRRDSAQNMKTFVTANKHA